MAPKFGTSGLRGLVTELTPELVDRYTAAFLATCATGEALYIGRDLRPSSRAIAQQVIQTASTHGIPVVDCGDLPTPALAMAAAEADAAAVMVTGSHIPADRNGLKFYTPHGEIDKRDESAISEGYAQGARPRKAVTEVTSDATAGARFVARYVTAFGRRSLAGLHIGVYQHSSVARDLMVTLIEGLGAKATPLDRSDVFIPVDTEALDPRSKSRFAAWAVQHGLDAIISTDGDADRPMLTDATGSVIPGDVLGAITARVLGATEICTPVSSNTMIDQMPTFQSVTRTRIGSPFVIDAMEETEGKVVGFEANGGFLLGFTAEGPIGPIEPLMTRDFALPIVATLFAVADTGRSVADLVDSLPARFTAADRLTETPTEAAQNLLGLLLDEPEELEAFFADCGDIVRLDMTDGLRVSFNTGDIVHLRPSGNAPEFRIYAEADSTERARSLVDRYMEKVGAAVKQPA